MDRSPNSPKGMEEPDIHHSETSEHGNMRRRLRHNPFVSRDEPPVNRTPYVPLENHENLNRAFETDPLAIREGLAYALGTDGHHRNWMVDPNTSESLRRGNRPSQGLSITIEPPNTDSDDADDADPFEYPDTTPDMTYDIPLITLDTAHAADYTFEANDDLESGNYRPPLSPGKSGGNLFSPGSPSKFSNMFARFSDRIAGSNHPPTPSIEKSPSAFADNEFIDWDQPERESSKHSSLRTSVLDGQPDLLQPIGSTVSPKPVSHISGASGVSQHSDSLSVIQRSPLLRTANSMESIHSIPTMELSRSNIGAPSLQVNTASNRTGMSPVTSMASPFFQPISRDDDQFYKLYLYGNTLRIFSPTSKIRIWCHKFLSHPQTNAVVLILILLQTLLLCYRQWDPVHLHGYFYAGYNWADYLLMLINGLYTIEIMVKVIAYGLFDDEVMFRELGLTYPRSGYTYAWLYLRKILHDNFFWWIPKFQKSSKKKQKTRDFEPTLKGKYTRFLDESESPPDVDEDVLEDPELSRETTKRTLKRNSLSSLTGAEAPATPFQLRNTFLQSKDINKKVDEMNLHRAFLRSSWQQLDFISVAAFWISLPLSINHYDAKHHLMIFRAISCIRILRLCNLTAGTNLILRACQSAIPRLVDVSIVIACFWVIFGIVGVQSFKSSLTRHCEWTNPDDPTDTFINSELYCGSFIGPDGHAKGYLRRDGEAYPYIKGFRCPQNSVCQSGENPYNGTINFDNILQSMQLVFVVMSVNAFSDLMYYLMDTDSLASSLFFIFGILVMTVWLMNIFIAVIVYSFSTIVNEESGRHGQRNERRKRSRFSNIWRFNDEMYSQQVVALIQKRKYLRLYYRAEYPIVLLIAGGLIIQCLRTATMPRQRAHFLYRCEAVLTGILLLEILLRFALYLPHWKIFFKSKINCVDLGLAVITSIIIIGPVKESLGHAYYWLTVFQIARFYRVVLAHRITSDLWLKLMQNAKSIFDLALFFYILLFLVSVIAARFFEGQVPPDDVDEVEFAMHTLPNTFLSLYVVASTENWADVMYNLQEYAVSTLQRSFGSVFIIMWFIIGNFIVLNIFIAVIARALEVSEDGKRKHQLRQFIEDMTQKIQVVGNDPGWVNQIKERIFGKTSEKNLERAVTNLLLSGSAVNDFLDDDEGTDDSEEESANLQGQPRGERKEKSWSRWNILRRVRTFYQNPFYRKKEKVVVVEGDFNPASFAKEVIMERKKLIQEQDEFLRQNPMFNTVFYVLGPRHKVRRLCQRIVPSSYGERIDGVDPNKTVSELFALVMFLSTIGIVITACYLTPILRRGVIDKHGQYNWTFYIDVSFIAIFTIEFIIKTTADGLLFTPNAYLRSPWNWLDFCALLSLWIELIAFLRNDGNLSRVVRGLKALRALRILTISETAKNNFQYTMISGFGKIISAGIISITLIFPFSVWGLNIFNGRLGYCVDGSSDIESCFNEYSNEVFNWEVLSPNVYVEPILQFNKFLASFSSLFEIVSLEGWTDLLINVMQSTGVGTPQEMFASPINGFFIILFNFTSVVFILTLFVSVIIDNYARVTGRAYLTNPQIQWYHIKKFLMQVKPSKRRRPETLKGFRKLCYRITVEKNKIWRSLMNIVLVLHVIALLVESFPESKEMTTVRYGIFTVSSSCFLVHYLMFAYAQGPKVFIANKWNIFCLVVSLGAWICTILSYRTNSGSFFMNVNKLFLVAMLVFVFPRSNRLVEILKFASASIPQIFSLLFTWFVMFLVYAIAMNQVFGMTKIGPNTSGNINVRSVPKALILLFRCSMGEGWNYIMEDFTLEAPFCQNADQIDDSDCGNTQYAYLLFISWNIISMYIMLNLFVSLVLDSFSYMNGGSEYSHLISRTEIRKFKKKWLQFDPEGSGFIDPVVLPKLLHSLDGSLSFHFYTGVLSIPDLCDKWIIRNNPVDPYDITVNYEMMNAMMLMMDIPKIQERRQQYERFLEEAIMSMELHDEPGISFKRLLLQLPLYNSFDSRQCLTLIDFLERRLFMQKLEKRLRTKRCRELIAGYALRWKYMNNKKEEQRRSYMDTSFDSKNETMFGDGYRII